MQLAAKDWKLHPVWLTNAVCYYSYMHYISIHRGCKWPRRTLTHELLSANCSNTTQKKVIITQSRDKGCSCAIVGHSPLPFPVSLPLSLCLREQTQGQFREGKAAGGWPEFPGKGSLECGARSVCKAFDIRADAPRFTLSLSADLEMLGRKCLFAAVCHFFFRRSLFLFCFFYFFFSSRYLFLFS